MTTWLNTVPAASTRQSDVLVRNFAQYLKGCVKKTMHCLTMEKELAQLLFKKIKDVKFKVYRELFEKNRQHKKRIQNTFVRTVHCVHR